MSYKSLQYEGKSKIEKLKHVVTKDAWFCLDDVQYMRVTDKGIIAVLYNEKIGLVELNIYNTNTYQRAQAVFEVLNKIVYGYEGEDLDGSSI